MADCRKMCGFVVGLCLMMGWSASPLWGITAEELADICAAKEAAILDISVECEWEVDPAPTLEGADEMEVLIGKGPQK